MILSPLYHWSPRERRDAILGLGLIPGMEPTCGSGVTVTEGRPMIALGATPGMAWLYSGGIPGRGVALWDLYEVELDEHAEVHVLPAWGPHVREVRVASVIPSGAITWVGERPGL